jgi:tetratricopeptide (TPR) repeat protein
MGRDAEAIQSLNRLLESSPIDAEAWTELAALYVKQGMYAQGMYALEEVLLITPNAWNVRRQSKDIVIALCEPDENIGACKAGRGSIRRFHIERR